MESNIVKIIETYIFDPFFKSLGYIFWIVLIAAFIPDIRGNNLEMIFYDLKMKLRYLFFKSEVCTPNISIVMLDDESIEYDENFDKAFSRGYLAKILRQVADKRPKVICLDFILNNHSSIKEGDKELEEAIEYTVNKGIDIVLASQLISTTHRELVEVKPIAKFSNINKAKIHFGYANLDIFSKNNVIRYIELQKKHKKFIIFNSFAYEAFSILKNEKNQEVVEGKKLIDFSLPKEYVYESFSAKQFEKPEEIELKDVVIIGASHIYAKDKFHTPITAGGFFFKTGAITSGAETHAYILHSLQENNLIPYFIESTVYLLWIVAIFALIALITFFVAKPALLMVMSIALIVSIALNFLFWILKPNFLVIQPIAVAIITVILSVYAKINLVK